MTQISSSTGLQPPSLPATRPAISAVHEHKPVTATTQATDQPVLPTQVIASAQATKTEASPEEMQRITDELQRRVNNLAPELQFTVEQSNGQSVMQFMDRTTNEVIRQFPSKETIQIGKALDKFERGLMINRKV